MGVALPKMGVVAQKIFFYLYYAKRENIRKKIKKTTTFFAEKSMRVWPRKMGLAQKWAWQSCHGLVGKK